MHILLSTSGEVENTGRKEQKDTNRKEGERRSVGWMHDILYNIRVNNMNFQVAFGEVVGNAFVHDEDKKMKDLSKILKGKLIIMKSLLPANKINELSIM